MKLIDEIVELAAEDTARLPVILRKCLIVASKLKNEPLMAWVRQELNGYSDSKDLPPYRVVRVQAKGVLVGPFGALINDQPLASSVLPQDFRWWATTAHLMQGISAYESLSSTPNAEGHVRIQWPGDLVGLVQNKFFEGYALNRAWQEIPVPTILALCDTVRNRLLDFALDIQSQLQGDEQLEKVPEAAVDRAVSTIIYGGNNVIAGSISGGVMQVGDVTVSQGDFASLQQALESLGLPSSSVDELKLAIEQDKTAGATAGLGERTMGWLAKATKTLGKGTGKVVSEVSTATLTKAVLAYFGLG